MSNPLPKFHLNKRNTNVAVLSTSGTSVYVLIELGMNALNDTWLKGAPESVSLFIGSVFAFLASTVGVYFWDKKKFKNDGG